MQIYQTTTLRDNKYLEDRLAFLWSRYFSDVKRPNQVFVRFGKKARKRLGSIRSCNIIHPDKAFDTLILVNGHFRNPVIPSFIIDATICHELCHYVHGFSSPLPQLSRFAHRGGIIEREMTGRGLADLMYCENAWLQENWLAFLDKIN